MSCACCAHEKCCLNLCFMILELYTDSLLSLQNDLKVYLMLLKRIALQKSKNPRVSKKSIFCAFSVHKKLQHFFETTIGYVYIWGLNIFIVSLKLFSVDLFEI